MRSNTPTSPASAVKNASDGTTQDVRTATPDSGLPRRRSVLHTLRAVLSSTRPSEPAQGSVLRALNATQPEQQTQSRPAKRTRLGVVRPVDITDRSRDEFRVVKLDDRELNDWYRVSMVTLGIGEHEFKEYAQEFSGFAIYDRATEVWRLERVGHLCMAPDDQ